MATTMTRNADSDQQQSTQTPVLMKQFRTDLNSMEAQFAAVLPSHISFARFSRVVITAAQNNPKLLTVCTRSSLFNACLQAAQDGLLPDDHEGTITPYAGGDEDDRGGKTAKWIPMIEGLRKKVRNSGALTDWNVQVVQQGDEFDFQLGDDPFIRHKPSLTGGRSRPVIAAYSIATYPDGTISREVMNADQLEDIRKKSKARRGPWSDPVFYPEMCRKTVARLHAKQLPMSTDIYSVLQRDDDTDLGRPKEAAPLQRPGSAAALLDAFASEPPRPPRPQQVEHHDDETIDAATGEVIEPQPTAPRTPEQYEAYAVGQIEAARDAVDLQQWWRSEAQRKMRNAAGVTGDVFKAIEARVEARCQALG